MSTQLIRGLQAIKTPHFNNIITIGNFDGVHLGHQALIQSVKELAKEKATGSLVVTFEPQPLEFLYPDKAGPRLSRFKEKYTLLAETQVDYVLVVKFDAYFSNLTAQEFIENILWNRLKVQQVIVGKDFRFGKGRTGDIQLLIQEGKRLGFGVNTLPDYQLYQERVSSTRIRTALHNGNPILAEALLGRPYFMLGRVGYGNQLGRELGFPTANIYIHRMLSPVLGIFVVRLRGITEKTLPGVAYVGTRPTVGGTTILLEVYLFNFNQMIYGRAVTVEFCFKLRDGERYANVDLLKRQMEKDAAEAKEFFIQRGELARIEV